MSMLRGTGRIRTTHTGSLPRPPDILETLHHLAAGQPVDMMAYETALTQHVRDIVRRQV
jgi:5-methyltetrahydropteroyltriglutamate--homocysteine methyltransferase